MAWNCFSFTISAIRRHCTIGDDVGYLYYLNPPQMSSNKSSFLTVGATLAMRGWFPNRSCEGWFCEAPQTSLVLNKLDCWGCSDAVPGVPHKFDWEDVLAGPPVQPELVPQAPTPVDPIMLVGCTWWLTAVFAAHGEATADCDEKVLYMGVAVDAAAELRVEKSDKMSCLTSFLDCTELRPSFVWAGAAGAWKSRLNKSLFAGMAGLASCTGIEVELDWPAGPAVMKLDERSWCACGRRVVVTGGAGLALLILPVVAWDGRGGEATSLDGGALSGLLTVDDPCSNTEGSAGGEPSIAHLRDSYFDLMNDSILLYMRQSPGSWSHEAHTVLVAYGPISNVPPNINWPGGCPISEWTVEELLSSVFKRPFG